MKKLQGLLLRDYDADADALPVTRITNKVKSWSMKVAANQSDD